MRSTTGKMQVCAVLEWAIILQAQDIHGLPLQKIIFITKTNTFEILATSFAKTTNHIQLHFLKAKEGTPWQLVVKAKLNPLKKRARLPNLA